MCVSVSHATQRQSLRIARTNQAPPLGQADGGRRGPKAPVMCVWQSGQCARQRIAPARMASSPRSAASTSLDSCDKPVSIMHQANVMSDRPLGPAVVTPPARRPERRTFAGRLVTLVPLEAAHADDLFAVAAGPENAWAWDYMHDGPFPEIAGFRTHIAGKAKSEDPLFFAILDKKNGTGTGTTAIGHATLMRIDTANGVIETGNIMFSPVMQRTAGATESMYLLARYVFDELGFRRYEWKCNALNAPSRRAAERLGFTFEGVFRQHMIVKGRNRDTAWFSMLDSEWPVVRQAFHAWLAPENFDDAGQQRRSLVALRAG